MPAQERYPLSGRDPTTPPAGCRKIPRRGTPQTPPPLLRSNRKKEHPAGGDQNSLRGKIRWTPLPTLPPRGEALAAPEGAAFCGGSRKIPNERNFSVTSPPAAAGKQIARAPSGAARHLPIGEAVCRLDKRKKEGPWGPFSCKGPQTPQIRLKYGAFRWLRPAAKGAAFGIRHLLEKVDENFAWAAVRRAKTLLTLRRRRVKFV